MSKNRTYKEKGAKMGTSETNASAIQAFPAAAIEEKLRNFFMQKIQVQSQLRGFEMIEEITTDGLQIFEPDIDSITAVTVLCELETLVPFHLPENIIKYGGYQNIDECIEDIIAKLQLRWKKHFNTNHTISRGKHDG
jgi:acyl carrier protein